jgi:hypothetical protein
MADLSTASRDLAAAKERLAALVNNRKAARERRDTADAIRLSTEIHVAFEDYCTARALLQAELVDRLAVDTRTRHEVRCPHPRETV